MRQGGFSLLELLVVVAIMAIIASITVARTDLMQADTEVKAAAQQIINLSKMSRQNSISVAEYQGIFPSYGLHFERGERKIVVYANCNPNDNDSGASRKTVDHLDNFAYNSAAHDSCAEEIIGLGPSDLPALIEEVVIENRTFVHSISASIRGEDPVEVEWVSINYLRPEPTVWITVYPEVEGRSIIPAGYVKITIRDKAERYEKDIIFYTSALVEKRFRVIAQ